MVKKIKVSEKENSWFKRNRLFFILVGAAFLLFIFMMNNWAVDEKLDDPYFKYLNSLNNADLWSDHFQIANVSTLGEYAKSMNKTLKDPSEDNKTIVVIFYTYEDQFMTDNYLGIAHDLTQIYGALFRTHKEVMLVVVSVLKDKTDNYGNSKKVNWAMSSMSSDTAKKINWENFDFTNLDKITTYDFYGESFYNDLNNLNNEMAMLDQVINPKLRFEASFPYSP